MRRHTAYMQTERKRSAAFEQVYRAVVAGESRRTAHRHRDVEVAIMLVEKYLGTRRTSKLRGNAAADDLAF